MPVVASLGLCNRLGRELGGLGMYRLQPIGVCGVWGGGEEWQGISSFACPLHLAAGEVVMVNSGGVPHPPLVSLVGVASTPSGLGL